MGKPQRIMIEDDLIYMTVGFYEVLYNNDPTGDALRMYMHLIWTARKQQTNQVWATGTYLKRGLAISEKRIKKARSLLTKLGIIEHVKDRDAKGVIKRWYTKIKTNIKSSPQGSLSTPVDAHAGGCDEQILKGHKEVLKGSKEEEGTPSKNGKTRHLEYVLLSEKEYEKLKTDYGDRTTEDYIERVNDYIGSKGAFTKYKSHYHTIKSWMRKDSVTARPAISPADKTKMKRYFTPREDE